MSRLDRLYEKVATRVPPKMASRADLLRPSFRASWGGPLNGQAGRQQIVRDLAGAIAFDEVVETGTYRGASTEFFAHVVGTPVLTVEAAPRFYLYAAERLKTYPQVALEQGDSRAFLRRLASRNGQPTLMFYLDAHWEKDLPLREEVDLIAGRWGRAVVIIDDFEVPDDPGYTFDDYGPGKRLCADYLPSLPDWGLFYPSIPASQETGARRGCGVLVSPALLDAAKALSTLRLSA